MKGEENRAKNRKKNLFFFFKMKNCYFLAPKRLANNKQQKVGDDVHTSQLFIKSLNDAQQTSLGSPAQHKQDASQSEVDGMPLGNITQSH